MRSSHPTAFEHWARNMGGGNLQAAILGVSQQMAPSPNQCRTSCQLPFVPPSQRRANGWREASSPRLNHFNAIRRHVWPFWRNIKPIFAHDPSCRCKHFGTLAPILSSQAGPFDFPVEMICLEPSLAWPRNSRMKASTVLIHEPCLRQMQRLSNPKGAKQKRNYQL